MAPPNWSPLAKWSTETLEMLNATKTSILPKISLEYLERKSSEFPIDFPTTTNRISYLKNIARPDSLTKNVNSAYPVMHESILCLCCNFVLYKREFGNAKERSFYRNMLLKDFLTSLIRSRPAAFLKANDEYKLTDGTVGEGRWENIGTPDETSPLTVDNYMTYDEIKLSAFLSVSSYSYFVNGGQRNNAGAYEKDRNKVQEEGVVVGMIGARLEKSNVMEHQDIVVTEDQNTRANGFGVKNSVPDFFARFYEEPCLTYTEASMTKSEAPVGRYTDITKGGIFDNYIYYKRLAVSLDTLLVEANFRGKCQSKSVYIHVVGLGLGVWKISDHQNEIFMESFAERIGCLGRKLPKISDIRFAHIKVDKCGKYGDRDVFPIDGHPNGGIKIHINDEDPHTKLTEKDSDKLLVVSYAWDANALPGNDYWINSLTGSGDSACACSTQICEVHNSHINPSVCVDNLKIVTSDCDVLSLEDYRKIVNRTKCKAY